MIRKNALYTALIMSFTIAIVILSIPEILEPLAKSIIKALADILPLAIFAIGIIHGLKPDEHTWPITISYAMMQKDLNGVIKSTVTFALALTTVWTIISAIVKPILSLGIGSNPLEDPIVDGIVGLTMIGVALFYIFESKKNANKISSGINDKIKTSEKSAPDYKLIWIHGTAAAFGGDFFIILIIALSVIAIIPTFPTFLVGLLFGLGSLSAQLVVVILTYKGLMKAIKSTDILVDAGRLSLLFLGVFMIGLGIFSFLTGS